MHHFKHGHHGHHHFFQQRRHKELEEYLEILWYIQERHGANMKEILHHVNGDWDPSIVDVLKQHGFIEETETEIKFTPKGYDTARLLVRSHRLAERLLTDVLGMNIDRAETGACEFEHFVVPEIVDSICTLLGHPKVCPHGMPIPPGACCQEAKHSIESPARSITELESGKKARVAYINTRSNSRMHQLTQLGIKPGAQIWVHQKYPTFVLRIDNTQIALDESVAQDILVWEQSNSGESDTLLAEE